MEKIQLSHHFQVDNHFTIMNIFVLQVLDALVNLFCRSNISAETLWDGGWALRQLLPYNETEFNSHHLELLKVRYFLMIRRSLE